MDAHERPREDESLAWLLLRIGALNQQEIDRLCIVDARRYLRDGEFPPGSMGPKIQAVIDFLRQGGKRALITDPASLPQAIDGRAGSHFIGKL